MLAFPPDEAELRLWQAQEMGYWRERERRARIALFFGAGMFLAWAADVGAAFEHADPNGSTLFGVISVPIALIVVLAHAYGQWTIERAKSALASSQRHYSDVTQREAVPLLQLAKKDSVVAQYLRCVGRQGRPLRKLERVALHTWADATDDRRRAPVKTEAL